MSFRTCMLWVGGAVIAFALLVLIFTPSHSTNTTGSVRTGKPPAATPSIDPESVGYVANTGTYGGASVGGTRIGAKTEEPGTTNYARPASNPSKEEAAGIQAVFILISIGLLCSILWWNIVLGKRFYFKEPWVIA